MPITVGFDLPFAAQVTPSDDGTTRIQIRCAAGALDEDLGPAVAHVAVFAEGALFGMGAGSRVAPRWVDRSVDAVLRVSLRVPGPNAVAAEATDLVFDPSYVVVLLHKLLALTDVTRIEEVRISVPLVTTSRPR